MDILNELKKAKLVRDQLSYGMGIEPERHTEILIEIGQVYIELVLKYNTTLMVEIEMAKYITTHYNKYIEVFISGQMYGHLLVDLEMAALFTALVASKKARE